MLAITGTSGFVGSALLAEVQVREIPYTILARDASPPPGTDTVIDLAGLAHGRADDEAFFQANHHRPMALLRAAKAVGVRRFVFVSSVAAANPVNAYGKSKLATETALLEDSGPIEVAIVRPPLVYGPGAAANVRLLKKVALTGLPLPFSSIDNRRSMIGRTNLVDALLFLAEVSQLPKEIYTITDGRPVSLTQIIEAIRATNGIPRRLFPANKALLSLALSLLGRKAVAAQLFGDLEFDDSKIRALGWSPPQPPLANQELV